MVTFVVVAATTTVPRCTVTPHAYSTTVQARFIWTGAASLVARVNVTVVEFVSSARTLMAPGLMPLPGLETEKVTKDFVVSTEEIVAVAVSVTGPLGLPPPPIVVVPDCTWFTTVPPKAQP